MNLTKVVAVLGLLLLSSQSFAGEVHCAEGDGYPNAAARAAGKVTASFDKNMILSAPSVVLHRANTNDDRQDIYTVCVTGNTPTSQ